jgi:hypothetical protein
MPGPFITLLSTSDDVKKWHLQVRVKEESSLQQFHALVNCPCHVGCMIQHPMSVRGVSGSKHAANSSGKTTAPTLAVCKEAIPPTARCYALWETALDMSSGLSAWALRVAC